MSGNTKPWARTPRRRPQLKVVFEHIFLIFAKSLLSVDYSEETPQGRIPLRNFWDKSHEFRWKSRELWRSKVFNFRPENSQKISRFFSWILENFYLSGIVRGVSREHPWGVWMIFGWVSTDFEVWNWSSWREGSLAPLAMQSRGRKHWDGGRN